jgi:hypothetical protein
MRIRNVVILVVAIVLLVVGIVWAYNARWKSQVAKVCQMQKDMFTPGKFPEREQFEKLQEAKERLSQSQRQEVDRRAFDDRRRGVENVINGYFDTPPEKQNEYLDKQIKQFDDMMKRMPPPPQRPGAPSGGPPAPPGGPPTQEQRQQWRNQFLDHTTPVGRARTYSYFAALAKRREELGLPMFPMGPRPSR